MLKLIRTDSDNKDFQSLVEFLNGALSEINGDKDDFFKQFNKIDSLKNVVVAYQNDLAVGCGAFKKFDENTVEIKRMYVNPTYRRNGIAQQILIKLETWASEIGYSAYILETSKDLTSAVKLYQKSGYEVIPNYGQYIGVESSVCMLKKG